MVHYDVYADMAKRTRGDVYLGVVGPVRTGKSTFIKRLMELAVLPNMEDAYARERATDELPQSGVGRTVMTTQPNFVPNEAVAVRFGENADVKLRLIDCVGYAVPGAFGMTEEDAPRMVRTPWFDEDIPFEKAAEIGTRKVITDHANIGVVMTTDGSFTGIDRADYKAAEKKVIADVKKEGKPFVIVLNTTQPDGEETRELAQEMQQEYDVAVRVMNVLEMTESDITALLDDLLLEFPVGRVDVDLPAWAQSLPASHPMIAALLDNLKKAGDDLVRMRDVDTFARRFNTVEESGACTVRKLSLDSGEARCRVDPGSAAFYRVLSDESGLEIPDETALLSMIGELAKAKKEYDRLSTALESARETGCGFVYPELCEMTMEDPEIVRQNGKFGVSLRASAPALVISRIDIETEVSPIIGTEKQSEELAEYLTAELEHDPDKMRQTNLFGKSLEDLVREGMDHKIARMPDDVQKKMTETMRRIINDGHGGVICVLL